MAVLEPSPHTHFRGNVEGNLRRRKASGGFGLEVAFVMSLDRRFLLILLVVVFCANLPPLAAQDNSAPTDETVANLAAGRVIVAVVRNAILVATVENPVEVETRPPRPVELAGARLGILLGPVFWWSPTSKVAFASLDQELPGLHSRLVAQGPHLQPAQGGEEAADVEGIGQGLLERLSDVVQNLHSKVDLGANEPLVRLVVADYLPGYGPEIWELDYRIKQQEEQGGYWTTRVLRPAYLQFWPPEKGQPRTLVEFAYPDHVLAPLLDLLRQRDPRLEKILSSDAKMAQVASQFLGGESNKVSAADATQFLRATLDATAPPSARETMAIITEDKGCDWILAPPIEPKVKLEQTERTNRLDDAPSLLKGSP
ncbi:MAG TPA: hypothetical protein VEJ45_10275 [Candidatus Acidoferrales bacterium]|nr:hypothetical protein [Candidatus Acidoferrales bacterium]